MDKCNRDPRLEVQTCNCNEEGELKVEGCPGNSFDIATRKYVMAALGAHSVDPNAHFLKFKELEDKIDELTGGISTSSIQIYDAYGVIKNQIRADLTVLVDGVLKKLATTDEITSVSPTAIPEITANIKALQDSVAVLHNSVVALTGTTQNLTNRVGNLETSVSTLSANKQDALYFSTDFLTSGNNVSLNYGLVEKDSVLPVKGGDIFNSFTSISSTITTAVTATATKEMSSAIATEVSGKVLTEVRAYIPTITFKTL